jgi:hypothetical protein
MWELIDAHHDELQALMPVATIFAALIAILVTGSAGDRAMAYCEGAKGHRA